MDVWRAVLRWFQTESLPGAEAAERRALECLRTRPAARKFGKHTLARILREPVGSPVIATPRPTVTLARPLRGRD